MTLNKKLLPVFVIIVGVAMLMLFLHFRVVRPAGAKNGFVRSQPVMARLVNTMTSKTKLVNIAGILQDSLYLGTREPGKLVVTDPQLQGQRVYYIPVTDTTHRTVYAFRTILQEGKFYTTATNVPAMMIYDPVRQTETIHSIDRAISNGVILPGGDLVMRSTDASRHNRVIRKINPVTGSSREDDNIIPRLNDGGFATDGVIHYDQARHTIQYIHFYSNKVLVLDTNLHLLATRQTIDTFSQYQAKGRARQTGQGTSFGFAEPPRAINAHSMIDNGKLYVMSWLQADNDTDRQYASHTVIDVYDSGSGNYQQSIYLPKAGSDPVFHFYVAGNTIWTLYGNRGVAQYKIAD